MRWSALSLAMLLGACRGQDAAPGPIAPPSTVSAAPAAEPTASAPIVPDTAKPTPQPAAGAASGAKVWSFDADTPGAQPKGFSFGRTGDGREGTWIVVAGAGAPSGANVLAQTDADATDGRFPVAFADEPVVRDVDLSVRCKPVSGGVDQACGMVFRLKDANNYYVTRANALENNVRLYFVKDGRRQQIATWNIKVASGAWHEYRVVAQGDHFEVYWDGVKGLDHHDKTFGDAGKIGLWTKADSVTWFDDLRVTPL